ncbi:MAG: UbiD family decarboxylase domain-containing protein [Phycisphaerales bacterium JB037]
MHPDLHSFIRSLEEAGELVRIGAEVDPVLEIAEIADRVSKSACPGLPGAGARRTDPRFFDRGGPALLFEKVRGSRFPVLINAFGSYRRMAMALGADRHARGELDGFEGIAARIGDLVKPEPPRGLGEAIAKARQFAPLLRIGPKRSGRPGACQEVVVEGDAVDLTTLPIIRCWPMDGDFEAVGYPSGVNDGVPGLGHRQIDAARWEREFRGRYITLAGIHTIHADDAGAGKPRSHNIGMYRVQLLGKRTMAMHWHVHHDGASHWRSWKKRGEPMPVAIALGGESVLAYSATAPLPPGISELLMAGFLNGRGIRMCRARTVPLWVPANAEIVIEGFVSHEAGPIGWDPRDERAGDLGPGAVFEGPFGDHTGFYSMPDRYPILTVTAVTHRRNAVYPTTIVGLPPQEDYFLGKGTERMFLPLLKTLIHDIEDYDLPMFGAFHNAACVRIAKAYPMQARRVMHAVWGAGQMAWTKTIFVVDGDVDVHDTFAVLRAASAHCDPARDLEMVRGPLDILDHAAPRLGVGTKIGFDCTPKASDEDLTGSGIAAWEMPGKDERREAIDRVRAISGVVDAAWPEELGGWVLVSAGAGGNGRRVAREAVEALGGRAPFVVVVGEGVDLGDPDRVLFHWCANCDAGRDLVRVEGGVRGCVAFDATPKRPEDATEREPVRAWPPIIEMDAATRARVSERWGAFGLG